MLITSRTPLRVSFFGGGTDYPEYFERTPGAVVGMAIDKYIYISALRLSTVINYRYRVSYSKLETVQRAEDISHPVVRSVLKHFEIDQPLDINIMADLPASSGLGSSSAFTVGFLNLVKTLQAKKLTKLDLGLAAIHVERELLKERVGVQDQLHAAFGGMNRFDFVDGRIRITPVHMSGECQSCLLDSLVLVYTGITRYASETLKSQIEATLEKKIDTELSHLMALTNQAVAALECGDPEKMLADFGAMMHEGWMTKRKLSSTMSNRAIDALYEQARGAGALGGKLCGAGAGGFLLLVVPVHARERVCEALVPASIIPVGLDTLGATILYS
jgi:D-glycero-alpha-D-manno-heptose-7-phosphate kinase